MSQLPRRGGLLTIIWLFIQRLRGNKCRDIMCRSCGYDLSGLTGVTCSECGRDLRKSGVVEPSEIRRWPIYFFLFLLWSAAIYAGAMTFSYDIEHWFVSSDRLIYNIKNDIRTQSQDYWVNLEAMAPNWRRDRRAEQVDPQVIAIRIEVMSRGSLDRENFLADLSSMRESKLEVLQIDFHRWWNDELNLQSDSHQLDRDMIWSLIESSLGSSMYDCSQRLQIVSNYGTISYSSPPEWVTGLVTLFWLLIWGGVPITWAVISDYHRNYKWRHIRR